MDYFSNKFNSARQKLVDNGYYDPRYLTLAVILFVALSVFWNGARIIQQNFELSQKVAALQEENEILELENRNKELRNEYYKTNEFADITARRVFGKAAAGEKVYIVPKETALNSLTTVQAEDAEISQEEKSKYRQNIESWLNIYFGN